MLLCNISGDCRNSCLHCWCWAFAQTPPTLWLRGRDEAFWRPCLHSSLVPMCVMMWEWQRSSVRWGFRRGGTVRSLHVCTWSAFWLCFLQKSNKKRPVAPFEREDLLLLLFSWKIAFFSLLSSRLPIKAETTPCFAKLPVFLYFSGKINTVLFPA